MGKTHKKAVLLIMLVAATLAGTAFALFPAWEQHRAEKEQEAMLSRLEMSMQERETALQAEETSFLQETGEAVAGTVVLTDTLSAVTKPEPERKLEAAAEMEKESILETAKEMEKISATMAAPVGEAAEIVAELAAQIPEKDWA